MYSKSTFLISVEKAHQSDHEDTNNYIQVPERRHQDSDEKESTSVKENHTEEKDEKNISLRGGESSPEREISPPHHIAEENTGDKYENIPTRKVTERKISPPPLQETKEHKMLETENSIYLFFILYR